MRRLCRALDAAYLLLAAVKRQQQAMQDGLRSRRTAWHVDVDGQPLVDSAGGRVTAANDPAAAGAGADGDDQFGSGVASYVAQSAGSRWRVTAPVTSSRSAWRGEATKSMPKRCRS